VTGSNILSSSKQAVPAAHAAIAREYAAVNHADGAVLTIAQARSPVDHGGGCRSRGP